MKGQGKALELVLVLFVLIVVVYVILQLFQSLLSQQTGKLNQIISGEEAKMEVTKAQDYCRSMCNAYQTNPSEKTLASFCTAFYEKNIDLNGDGKIDYAETSNYPEISLTGIGTCENRIPCFLIYECKSGTHTINANDCKDALCRYYENQGMDNESIRNRINTLLNPGSCYDKSKTYHWYAIAFGGKNIGELTCGNSTE